MSRTTPTPARTYDVTAISGDGQHVPLTAGTGYSMAHDIARPRSTDGTWAKVEIRVAETGELIAAYAAGVITEGGPR
jgi:hypothetical protein